MVRLARLPGGLGTRLNEAGVDDQEIQSIFDSSEKFMGKLRLR
jgi:hypothetical protein